MQEERASILQAGFDTLLVKPTTRQSLFSALEAENGARNQKEQG
jgi:hypothetical protein